MKIASDAPLPPSAAQAGPPVRTDKAQVTTFMIAATLRARPAAYRRPAQGHLLAPHLDGQPPRPAGRRWSVSRKSLTTGKDSKCAGSKCNCKRFATGYIRYESTMPF